ncbi:MAG: two-CW domain-containing protein [Candidatus Aquicultor sp.]
MNCWEFTKCGRDKTSDCPAYPLNGKRCWLSAGTLCDGQIQGTFAQKLGNCTRCEFYKSVNGEHIQQRVMELGGYRK